MDGEPTRRQDSANVLLTLRRFYADNWVGGKDNDDREEVDNDLLRQDEADLRRVVDGTPILGLPTTVVQGVRDKNR